MMKKVLIVGLLVACLFISTISVSAVNEEKTFTDPANDVLDLVATEEQGKNVTTSDKPNIDLRYITYIQTGSEVQLSLEVQGKIENRGDLEDQETFDLAGYEIFFYSNEESYEITYVNKTVTLNGETAGITYDTTDNDKNITFTFNLTSPDEIYDG